MKQNTIFYQLIKKVLIAELKKLQKFLSYIAKVNNTFIPIVLYHENFLSTKKSKIKKESKNF